MLAKSGTVLFTKLCVLHRSVRFLEKSILLNLRWCSIPPLHQLPTDSIVDSSSQGLCKAVYRQLPISSKKLTPVARLVRKMRVEDALYQCDLLQRKGAGIVQNAIKSAKANGVQNHGLDGNKLVVQECYATNGSGFLRKKFHGRGRYGIMRKQRTHLTVILREDGEMNLRPHVIQPSWMERELNKTKKTQTSDKEVVVEDKIKKPRMKWKKMLRVQKRQKLRERQKAKQV